MRTCRCRREAALRTPAWASALSRFHCPAVLVPTSNPRADGNGSLRTGARALGSLGSGWSGAMAPEYFPERILVTRLLA